MVIPEGDWFCPDCNHKSLVSTLEDKLSELDVLLKKTEAERRRKERLAFINKGLSRALPTQSPTKKAVTKKEMTSESSSSESDSEDEPELMMRRCRTVAPKYNTEEYDQLIKKALGEDLKHKLITAAPVISEESEEEDSEEEDKEKVSPGKPRAGQGKGKDIDNYSEEESDEEKEDKAEKPPPIKMKINTKMKGKGKKKKRRLADLSDSDQSGDGDSGSDFAVSDAPPTESEFEPGSEEESDDSMARGRRGKGGKRGRGGEGTRRSTRNRRTKSDDDFVVDGSEDSEDYRPKKRSKWSESEMSDR